jgi:hypothetical protein
MTSRSRVAGVALILTALALGACGGGSSNPPAPAPPPPPPPPSGNTAPVASFTAATTVVAGVPLVLDASSSTDANGDALTYTWTFGNGQLGGGQKIAPVFDSPGSFTVTLTVDDAHGGSNTQARSVTVTTGAAATGSVDTLAIVRDSAGALLPAVTVSVAKTGGATASTGTDGRATIATDRGIPVTLKFSKAGYADQFKTLNLPTSAESGFLTVTMLTREAPLTLASAAAGGTLTGKDGAKVTFPPNSLVDAAGAAVTGAVQVSMTPVNVATNDRAFPGRFEGVRTTGEQGIIVSYGTVEFALSVNGAAVQLAPGKKATIELPIYIGLNLNGAPVTAGSTFPLWSLNERTGGWTEEGVGTVVAGTTPSDLSLRAEVSHFSWWNHDQFVQPPGRPKPKCMVDSNHDGIFEDLTGTGYCWHEAQVNPVSSGGSSKITNGDEARRMWLADPVTVRLPAYAATAITPVSGGVVLPIPPDVDVMFRSYANNGSLFGQKIVRLGAGVEQEVIILMEPIQDASGVVRLSLPAEAVYGVATPGEVDQFVFAATAGTTYEVSVSRPVTSLLGGNVRITTAANAQLSTGAFGPTAFSATVTPTASGDLNVSVTADGNAPGAYTIAVRALASTTCSTPASLAVPSTTTTLQMPANSVTCFNVVLAADNALQVVNTQMQNLTGAVTLFAPSGEQLATDAYAGTGAQVQLYAAVAQAGTYRLQFTNTGGLNGSIQNLGLSLLTIDATFGVPDTAAFAGPASAATSHWYLVKPPVIGSEFALTMNGNGIGHNFRVHPFPTLSQTSDITALVIRKSALVHPLVQVTRVANTAWNFTLNASVPLPLTLNTEIAIPAAGSDVLRVYRFDGLATQLFRVGVQHDPSISLNPQVTLPTLQLPANPTNSANIYSALNDGVQTLLVRNSDMASGDFSFRLHALDPVEQTTLGALTTFSSTLALGDVKRYGFDVTQGQVLSLELSSTDTVNAVASLEGATVSGSASTGEFPLPGPRYKSSSAMFVQQNGIANLVVFSPSPYLGYATGPITARIHAPTPTPTALGATISTTLNRGELKTYGYVAAAGSHLLCVKEMNGVFGGIDAHVWGPSPNTANGDLGTLTFDSSVEFVGPLRAGVNTLSLLTGGDNALTINARLVNLVAPTALTLGAPASAGAVTACERDYFSFAGVADQAYTVRVTAAFAGEVRVRKLLGNGDYAQRIGGGAFEENLGTTPLALAPNVERVVTFTIPANATFGTGTYLIEVDGTDDAAGAYTVSVSSP